jgi:hypothetical protein
MKTIWECKIGEVENSNVPDGGDSPMRKAVEAAYIKLTGKAPEFIFSGWGAKLDGWEQSIVDRDRKPKCDECRSLANWIVGDDEETNDYACNACLGKCLDQRPTSPVCKIGSQVYICRGEFYWRAKGCGLTKDVHEAGKFDRDNAEKYTKNVEGLVIREIV